MSIGNRPAASSARQCSASAGSSVCTNLPLTMPSADWSRRRRPAADAVVLPAGMQVEKEVGNGIRRLFGRRRLGGAHRCFASAGGTVHDRAGTRRQVVDDDRRRRLLLLRLDLLKFVRPQRRECLYRGDARRPVGLAACLRGLQRVAQRLDWSEFAASWCFARADRAERRVAQPACDRPLRTADELARFRVSETGGDKLGGTELLTPERG